MSRLSPNQLTARKVETLRDGSYADGGNLWITVSGKSKNWSIRYKSPLTGSRREMGIGPLRDVPLAVAREKATEARRLIREGIDPIERRKDEKAARILQDGVTFEAVATQYVDEQKAGWRDTRLAPIWVSSLTRLAFPAIGKSTIGSIDTEDVLGVLRPIWTTKTETADRLRGRIERILDYATSHGWREGENPARWRGHLANILPKPSSVAKIEHHAAIPWRNIATVMAALQESNGMSALAVRFTCLTCMRSGEVRGARWREVDLDAKLWAVPPERMKTAKEHRVPLSAPAIEILLPLRDLTKDPEALVFPGRVGSQSASALAKAKAGELSDVALSKALHLAAGTKEVTVHGLRSTFRDWAAEHTDFPRDVAEMALAHAIGSKVEAAYRRGDLFEKRREMMEGWARWCLGALNRFEHALC
jgi:integrase